MGVYLAKVYTH